jgi:hypothetical protein
MKSLLVFIFLFFTFGLQAKSIKVYETYHYSDAYKAEFEVNKELGRAWIKFIETTYGEDGGDNKSRFKVPGLSYDTERSVITLDHEGRLIDCAEVYDSGRFIFRMTKIRNLNCSLKTQVVKVQEDNGFEIRTVKKVQVLLKVE